MPDALLDALIYAILLAPLGAVLCVGLGARAHRPRRALDAITIGFSAVSILASLLLAAGSEGQFPRTSSVFFVDELSAYFLLLVNLVAFFAAWYVPSFLDREPQARARTESANFHISFNLFHFTMVLVPMLDNLVLLWMAVEFTTLISTLLVRYRGDRRALEAAWKYLTITTTGIIFALLGTAFLAAAFASPKATSSTGSVSIDFSLMSWHQLMTTASKPDLGLVKLAFLFVLVGYGAKAGFAPMHTWLPDGHGEAPSPVSALLSGVLLKSALFAILRFYTLTNQVLKDSADPDFASSILLMVGLFSLAIATPFILKPNRFKRLLAYHSLEHMGIIAFGLGIGGPIAVYGALLHALNHALTKALMFLTYGHAQTQYARHRAPAPENPDHEPLHGVLKALPLHGGLLAAGGLALVGSPPFNIFQSEFIILWAAVTGSTTPWSILAVAVFLITVTLIFGGLVVHLARLLLGPAPFQIDREGIWALAPLLMLMLIIVVFGFVVPIWPIDLPGLIQRSVQIVLNTKP
ncbi:MAG TPA: proton-conducting transporter membrane subunit [Anaerolineae bacterium]|nr:proton-conducting transporter membrane subunit [Anaerolineae bacterium]